MLDCIVYRLHDTQLEIIRVDIAQREMFAQPPDGQGCNGDILELAVNE